MAERTSSWGRLARAAVRLSAFYARNPQVLARHAGKGYQALAQGGLPLFRDRARAALSGFRAPTGPAFAGKMPVNRTHSRGTIVIVTHDAEIGGAQQVIRSFAEWLIRSTRYRVKFVMMRGGSLEDTFEAVAPTCNIAAMQESMTRDEVTAELRKWAGDDVRAILLNTAASGGFLDFWTGETPVLAYIHELGSVLRTWEKEFDRIRRRAKLIVCASDAVASHIASLPGENRNRLRVVSGFIEDMPEATDFDFHAKGEAKRALGIDENAFVVAACGVVHGRKGPAAFVDVAEKVLSSRPDCARFIWFGGGPDQRHCEALVEAKGLAGRVTFTGIEKDVHRHLKAADLFLLPSEEDPFPLVCLYAAATLAPVICFEEAGGMPGFVGRGAGRAVPFKDNDAMARAVLDYINDEVLRRRKGMQARALVLRDHTVSSNGPRLLHHIREAAGLDPEVSVIVPSYNCAPYLEERLGSIAAQTFQDFELILIDDRSTDGSLPVLRDFAERRPGTRLIVNDANSGSPFPQWLKGMELARAGILWIAEADDSCEPGLLATLLPAFDDRNVFLAHAKSVPVDADGRMLGDYEPIYLDRIARGRWSSDHVATDHEEANQGLGIANSIPNASAVLFRRFVPEERFTKALLQMKLCGDWFFYIRAMRGGLVSYSAQPLNRHRRHDRTVTRRTEGSARYFDEFATVRREIAATYRLSGTAQAAIRRFTLEDLDRFHVTDEAERRRVLDASPPLSARQRPSLLAAVSDLSPGGGQIFGIRLANEWVRSGGRAILLNVRHFPDHPEVVAKIDPAVAVYHADEMEMSFGDLLARFDIDLIHSSIWWADRYVHDHVEELGGRPWIVTMHGCYETHLDHPAIDVTFQSRIRDMLSRVGLWVHTAEKNRRVFSVYGEPRAQLRIENGVGVEPSLKPLTRSALGLREGATVLCLASRAIPEKGWREAVTIVDRLNRQGKSVDLMLLGEGPVADELARQAPPNVRLYGHVANLQDYIAASDICILPSYFAGESMPLVLLEAMANGKPVVATDVAEIPDMIGSGQDAAGAVVPLLAGQVDIEGFTRAVERLIDPVEREAAGRAARHRFEKAYTIEGMVAAYGREYQRLLKGEEASLATRTTSPE